MFKKNRKCSPKKSRKKRPIFKISKSIFFDEIFFKPHLRISSFPTRSFLTMFRTGIMPKTPRPKNLYLYVRIFWDLHAFWDPSSLDRLLSRPPKVPLRTPDSSVSARKKPFKGNLLVADLRALPENWCSISWGFVPSEGKFWICCFW